MDQIKKPLRVRRAVEGLTANLVNLRIHSVAGNKAGLADSIFAQVLNAGLGVLNCIDNYEIKVVAGSRYRNIESL